MGVRDLFFFGVVLVGTATLGAGLFRPAGSSATRPGDKAAASKPGADPRPAVAEVNAAIRKGWVEKNLDAAPQAPELAVMRRLSLALTGSIPSLEEIRRFEKRPAGARIDAWVDDLLHDRRFADYLAERMARAFVGTEDGPFVLFRRRRFASWLSDAILANRPYDAIVRDMIADKGLWTDHPATNFVSVTFNPDEGRPDPERLAARVSRAFLGVRIDCAQCHDHPFQPWKQGDFRSLAAFFGEARSDLRGIGDGEARYHPLDRKTKEATDVSPRVPSLPELCPDSGSARERLAAWVVNPKNPSLARATTNRVWALLLGRPLVEPVDDLPLDAPLPPALTVLADDFSSHGFDLHRLIRLIVASEVFRLDSLGGSGSDSPSDAHDTAWAAFPMTRLRPEQVAGALYQSASLTTLGPGSHWVTRFFSYTSRNDFVRRYGDTGEDEFDARAGTIPQRLLLMNGDLAQKMIKQDPLNASTQIAALSPDDRKAVEVAYLSILTRRPSAEESAHFEARLKGTDGDERKGRLTDLYWTLLNSTEFSWNH
ncbi:MAG: hypothetical protein JWN86_3435 [Planctomycetota bacterium]|nr:hypothetical protein [Planctomycetota bacterium]